MNLDANEAAKQLVNLEGRLLDQKKWDEWLALYAPDAEYWIPAWNGDLELTTDPRSQLSLIYYPTRSGLEDRVFRIRTNLSSASTPLPRTSHMISNILVEPLTDGKLFVTSSWQVHAFRNKKLTTYAGHYEHTLRPNGNGWLIARKKTVVINDVIPSVLDIYNV